MSLNLYAYVNKDGVYTFAPSRHFQDLSIVDLQTSSISIPSSLREFYLSCIFPYYPFSTMESGDFIDLLNLKHIMFYLDLYEPDYIHGLFGYRYYEQFVEFLRRCLEHGYYVGIA